MGLRIQQLPPAIANQIAAGEVIERPASVVKELLENSLDANADSITIEINYGGLNQIRISDNGVGIVAEDLPLAIAAHATSKITKLDDLYAISSMGFRGEALASIASIAKLSISSRTQEQEHAAMLKTQGREIHLQTCARNVGTTIEVADLFFNAPVRKRFLKSEKLEFQAIETVVKRFALSAPHIAVTLKHNDKLILSLPAAHSEQAKLTRMSKILGSSFINAAVFLDVEWSGMQLRGWISGPNLQRSQNDKQWIYINQRMVKDKLLNHALKQVYDGYLHPGRFPVCLLYFSISSDEVDVNVHPTKHEVRFQQPRLVHDFFTSQLAKALNSIKKDIVEQHDETAYFPQELLTTINEPGIRNHNPPLRHEPNRLVNEQSWIFINEHYALIGNGDYYLVDVKRLHQQGLQHFLRSAVFPLAHRPLLVPISYDFSMVKPGDFQSCLKQLGMQSEFINGSLKIKSVPISIPHLDIRFLMELLSPLDSINHELLINLICKAQTFDARLLSKEECHELMQLLTQRHMEIFAQNVYKVLTKEVCEMLLNV